MRAPRGPAAGVQPALIEAERAPKEAHPSEGRRMSDEATLEPRNRGFDFSLPQGTGSPLRPPLQNPVPTIPPRPRRHPSTRNSFLFPLAFCPRCCRANLSDPSRRQNLIQLQHLHRCQLELALCKGLGSPGSYQTELRRVGFLFSFLFHFY